MLYLPAEFPQDSEICYLNHAAVGPWPRRTAQAVADFAFRNMQRGGTDYPERLDVERRVRERLAQLINAASPDDIALVQNTSVGLSIVSQGLDWRDGDEVVGIADDFCSNTMVWQALGSRGVHYVGVDSRAVPDPEGALIAAITDRTRLLAISSVHFATGYRFDLQRLSRICREHGVLFSVDAIQSLGAVRFDLATVPADFVIAGGHKWLLSAEGLGFLYCRAELRDALKLHQFGWAMRESPYAFEAADWQAASSARRFEAGTPNMLGIYAMDASLSLFEEIGIGVVEQRLAENLEVLESGLGDIPDVELITPSDPDRRAGIVTFRHTTLGGATLHRGLLQRQVVCSPRAGGVRLSPHFYTPNQVLERAVKKIRQTILNIIKNT